LRREVAEIYIRPQQLLAETESIFREHGFYTRDGVYWYTSTHMVWYRASLVHVSNMHDGCCRGWPRHVPTCVLQGCRTCVTKSYYIVRVCGTWSKGVVVDCEYCLGLSYSVGHF
jgi:hypothetical protein